MGYNLLINGVYCGYNPITNHLLTSWDIQVAWDWYIYPTLYHEKNKPNAYNYPESPKTMK